VADHVIPNAVILPPDSTGQATPARSSRTVRQSSKTQVMSASRDSVIPVIYGGPERTAGMLYTARIRSGKLVLCLILCDGGSSGVQAIDAVELNDVALTGGSWSSDSRTFSNGVIVKRYFGTQTQVVDPTLAAAISGFTETMAGTAYIVVQIPPSVSQGFPRITVEVKGLKVYDPRDSGQLLVDPTTWLWSDNPALCLADFLSNSTYGARRLLEWPSYVSAAADRCDDLCGTEKRCLITLTLAEERDVEEWVDVLRGYIPAWVDYVGAVAYIIPDNPRAAADFTFTSATIDSDPRPVLIKRGIRNRPNVVEIGYMKTDVRPWATDYAVADLSPTTRRKARVDMPGIRRYSQAYRFAVERLNHYNLEALETQIGVFEDGLRVMIGDRVDVTDDIGLAATPMRVTARQDRGHGRWLLGLRKYDVNAYENSVQTSPTTPDTGLPDPHTVQAPTALVITETIYLEKDLGPDSLARGLIYQSRFDVTWTASTHAYPVTYGVKFFDGATVIHEGSTQGLAYASPAVQQGKTYVVDVTARNELGFVSSVLEGTQAALGKLLPPGNVPAIIRALEIGGEVLLEIEAAIDIDIQRYEWRYGPVSGFTWEAAILIDQIDGLRARFKGLPIGPWRLAVKAIDSVGNYSPTETTVDLTVTSDSDAFIQDHEFTAPTLTNMLALPMLEGVWKQRWETSVAGDQWNSVMPNPVNSGGNPVASYHASATSKFQGEAWDLGSPITGDWQLAPNTTDLTGTATYAIETSPDGSAWTPQAGVSYKGTARYVRPVIQTLTTGTILITAPPKISLAAVTHSEAFGPLTSNAGSAKTITLVGRYTSAVKINITPRGTVGRSYSVDNVVVGLGVPNTLDVYLFDAATGAQVASDFTGEFEGF
jgi:hypothetical protein